MASTINAKNTSSGLVLTPDASGQLELQTADTTRMTIDSSGNVGIGTSSPGQKLDIATSSGALYTRLTNGTVTVYSGIESTNNGLFGTSSNHLVKFVTNDTERMRIDSSGNVLAGVTAYINSVQSHTFGNTNSSYPTMNITNGTNANVACLRLQRYPSDGDAVTFFYGSTQKGYISVTSTGTTYNTLSDYRLKENVKPMVGALDKVAQLNPVEYDWIGLGKVGQGFIAHELQAVVPDCVSGEKDAVDAEGNPVYQGIDTSFLVATLTAAIKEQQELIKQLQADVAALKGAA